MIIDTNFLGGMLRATDKAIPGASDSDMEIPDTLLPVVETLLPLDVLASSATPMESSFVTEHAMNRNNEAAGVDTLCTFNRGLWTFDFWVHSWTWRNGGALLQNPWFISLDYQGYNIPILSTDYWGTTLENVLTRRLRFLIRENGVTFSMNWQAATVNDRWTTKTLIHATKHL